jgi:hypothetical protein
MKTLSVLDALKISGTSHESIPDEELIRVLNFLEARLPYHSRLHPTIEANIMNLGVEVRKRGFRKVWAKPPRG